MTIFKKVSVASYILAFGAVIALIALIVGIAFTVLGIVCAAGAIALAVRFGERPFVSAVVALAVLFFALATCFMIIGKMDVMGTVIFSDLEKGYKPAEDACYIGLASSIVYIAASLVASAGAFFRLVRR